MKIPPSSSAALPLPRAAPDAPDPAARRRDSLGPARTRLTGRGAVLLFLSLAAVFVGALLPEPAAVQVGLLGPVLLALTWPLAARNLSGLRVVRLHPPGAFAGQLFPFSLELFQDGPRPSFAVEIEDSIAGPSERGFDTTHVPAGGCASRSFESRILRRGSRHRAHAVLTSSFPLGLWRAERILRDSLSMTIFPRPVTPRALEDAQDAALLDAEEEESSRRDWAGDFHGIRAFQPGDRLKLIHWPATARAGRLMVRQFDRRLPEKYSIFFHSLRLEGAPQDSPDAFESALELLCGLLLHCRDRGIPLDLTASFGQWRTLQVPLGSSLEPALNLLAAARCQPSSDAAPLLRALATTETGTRVFLLSEAPLSQWESRLPELPFAVTCLSLHELRVKRPSLRFASTAP